MVSLKTPDIVDLLDMRLRLKRSLTGNCKLLNWLH